MIMTRVIKIISIIMGQINCGQIDYGQLDYAYIFKMAKDPICIYKYAEVADLFQQCCLT